MAEHIHLDHPLLGLIANCETICEAACCGIDAFDFSPIHIASFLIRGRGAVEDVTLCEIERQLAELEGRGNLLREEGGRAAVTEMNQCFDGNDLRQLVSTIRAGITRAELLIADIGRYTGENSGSAHSGDGTDAPRQS